MSDGAASGFLYITGRLKDLLILAGGEKVAPAPIEMVRGSMPTSCDGISRAGSRSACSMP